MTERTDWTCPKCIRRLYGVVDSEKKDHFEACNGLKLIMSHPGPVLPTDSEERKQIPIFSGVLNYFPLALAAVARVSKRGNDKHNPGQPLHWSRGKSNDHADCIARHLIDVETLDTKTGEYEDAQALAWRALAKLQELEEARLGKPASRGSKVAPYSSNSRPVEPLVVVEPDFDPPRPHTNRGC